MRFRRVACVPDLRRRLGRPLLVAVGRRFCFWLWVALLAIGPSAAVLQYYYYLLSSNRVCSGHTAAPATPLGRLRSWLCCHPGENPVVRS